MSGGSRIVAFGSGSEPQPEHTAPLGEAEPHEAWPDEDEGEAGGARPSAREWLAPVIGALAIAGWTGFFGWANRALFASGITPGDGAALIGAWAPPVLLVCVAWLLALRTSRREAAPKQGASPEQGVSGSASVARPPGAV
ncbi:MAG: hypothetical protein EBV48_06960 [Betaproteobacteria bacterium]|nr:hypothetical protein [Betaproteobacteria bacterium]